MQEIGEKFKEARESMEISLEEASSDLKVEEEQLRNIEEGNIKSFDNVVALKFLIKDYSKYLGLDAEAMTDEYNEYLFDQTSKISLEDIKEAKRKLINNGVKTEKKIKSPYTSFKIKEKKNKIALAIMIIIILVLTFCLVFYVVINIGSKKEIPVEDVIR